MRSRKLFSFIARATLSIPNLIKDGLVMAYQDLREFISALDKRGLLQRIRAEVDPELEISEIADRVSKRGGPALLFENPRGSEIPVLINALGSRERMHL